MGFTTAEALKLTFKVQAGGVIDAASGNQWYESKFPFNPSINANRVLPTFYSSISNDIKDELEYNGVKISNLIHSGIGKTIGHLWFKKDIPDWFAKYIELVLIIIKMF